jgi:hypothetical protein
MRLRILQAKFVLPIRNPQSAILLCVLATLLAVPAHAQVNPSGTWRTLHTPHFRIHFRPAFRDVALDAAAEAERAYALLASELRAPRGTIDLTLADDVDAPNGFASTYPSNRFTILLVPPVADPGLRDYDSWRRLVIVHELAHLFHLDRSRRIWRLLQAVFGRAPGLFPNQFQPSWVVEGMATYYESRFTKGGRSRGGFHQQIVGADAAAGTARSPWDALLFTRWPDGLTPYAYGSRFWEYLRDSAGVAEGDSIVPRFVEASAGQLIPFRVGRPLRFAGAPRALSDAWPRAVAAAAPSTRESASRLIVGGLRAQPVPRVSPDGRRLAYLHADGRGAPRLRITAWPSGDAQTLRSHRVTGQVSYDWVGDTLIVAQLDFLDRWHVRSDLWHWLPDGTWRRATRGARLIEPRAGAAVVQLPGDNRPALPEGTPLPADPAGTTWGAVVPSPDGRWIAATRHQDGRWALVRWPAAAPESLAVLVEAPAPGGGDVADPSWMASELLFVVDVAGFPQVHAWSAEHGVAQLTGEPLGARAPAAAPDGTILFTTLAGDGWALRAIAPQPRAWRQSSVSAAAAFDSAPPVATRETGYASFGSLRPHFWVPLGFDASGTGRFFGGLTAGVDAVGRYAYVAYGMVSTSPLRAQGTFGVVTHALGNPMLDAVISNDWSHVGAVPAVGRVVSAEDYDASIGATLVTRRWRRTLALRFAAELEGTRYVARPDTMLADICTGCRRSDLVGGSVSVTAGSAVGAPLAVSPQDGAVATLLYRRREEQGSDRRSDEYRGRLALYARLGPRVGFAHSVLAARVSAGVIDGTLGERLSVGGVSSGVVTVAFGQSLGGGTRTFPVRGYDGGSLRGSRAASVSVEYRVPLALIGRSLGHLPLGVDKFSFALFGDVGDAWDAGDDARLHRARSVGLELVGDLTLSYDLPLRFRVGIAQPAERRHRLYGGVGADF